MKFIRNAILRWARNRQPDFVIGGHENPYLRRHWLLPRNRFFNVYVHEFLRSDDDRALHDHPWLFNASWLIDGEYVEYTKAAVGFTGTHREAGDWKFRWGAAPHRVELRVEAETDSKGFSAGWIVPCWTVFITGPVVREWGFYCKHGWVHWKAFTAPGEPGTIGKGCDQ